MASKLVFPSVFFAVSELALKRKLTLPVSRTRQRWVRRSSNAVVIFASPKTLEDENRRLKHMFADLSMQADLLREALGKM